MREFEFKELEEATESFSGTRLIGKGSHGNVYKGEFKDGQLIAVKKQSAGLQKLQDNSKLENEIRILSSLSHHNSPYLISLAGISHDATNNKVLVMEFMPNGTLEELLHANSVCPGWDKRAEIAIRIAKGVQFLHEAKPSPIVHRDIKSANVLFDSDWNARLCDFGLAVRLDNESHDGEKLAVPRNRPAGTIGYLDPSYTIPGKLSTKIDIFSFGVLLLEIISGRKAMDFSRSPSLIVEWAIPMIRKHRSLEVCDKRIPLPRFMEGVIGNMLIIASRCLLSKEENRPSMNEVVAEMQSRRTFAEPVRFPAWMNLLHCSLILLKGPRKLTGLTKDKSSPSATVFCYGDEMNGDDHEDGNVDDMSKGKMMLWEILADIS